VADGVVIGSALVELCGAHGAEAPVRLRERTAALAHAVHTARQEQLA
jgi:tryptophan synthase alpha chain